MEHFWTPFFTFLSGIVVAVGVPIVVWYLAQLKEKRARATSDADEERDYELECLRWNDYHTHVNTTFALLFQLWREGKDLGPFMVQMDLAIRARPSPPPVKKP